MGRLLKLGIDLGGTKTELIVLDKNGKEVWRERQATPSYSYTAILNRISEMILTAEHKISSISSIGIGMPGSLMPETGLIQNSNTTVLNGKPFKIDIERLLSRPVRIENDANCFTLSEAIDGAGKDYECVFGVILGTGCGGGIVLQRAIWKGRNLLGGEWGHNPLPWARQDDTPGLPCYCGKTGCMETYLSGTGLTAHHKSATGENKSAKEIVNDKTEETDHSLSVYCDRLARGLASVINILDPSCIVLGGGLSNCDRIYETVPGLLQDYVFSDKFLTPVLKNVFGDASGVRGAAWLTDIQ